MKAKVKKRVRRLDELSKFRIEALAKGGWFSYRYIASIVFGRRLETVDDHEVSSVSGHCHRAGVKLTDGRNGLTVLSANHARHLVIHADKRFKKSK